MTARASRPITPWLFPLSYLAHATDEALAGAGFPAWFSRQFGAAFSLRDFLVLNGVGILVLTLAALLAQTHARLRPGIVGVLSTIVFLNGSLHFAASAITGAWVPGVLTGTLVWIPLGLRGLIAARGQLAGRAFLRSLAIGVAIHTSVTGVALYI